MASTIQIKNSTTGGNSPSSLAQGEFAINVIDGNLFYGDGSNVKQDFAFGDITGSNAVLSGTLTLPGIANVSASINNKLDSSGTITTNDYAKFDASGDLVGRSYSEVKTDLSLNNVENTALSTYTGNGGALDNQYITNGAGYTTNTGTVTSIGGTGTVSGLSLSGTVTTSGNLTLGVKTDLSLNNVENTALSTWAGSSNITSVGTLGSLTMGGDIDMDGQTIDTNGGQIDNAAEISSNVFRMGSGGVTTPSLAFSSDTNTGIYAIAPDTLGITTGGSQKIFIGNSVGVGVPFSVTDSTDNTNTTLVNINNTNTGAPISTNQYSLKVNGGAAYGSPGTQTKSYGGYFTAGDTNTANPDSVALYAQGHEDGAPNSYAALFSGSAGGVVGINTMEPTVELDVVGDISASNNIIAAGKVLPQYESKVSSFFSSDSNADLIPFGGTLNENTLAQYYNTVLVPYGGKVIKAYVLTTSSGTGAFTLTIRKYTGLATYTDIASGSATISTSYTPTLVEFSDHTFEPGDNIGIWFDPTGTPSGVNVTSLWRMESI